MGAGRPKAELVLTESESELLSVWARRRKLWRFARGSCLRVPPALKTKLSRQS